MMEVIIIIIYYLLLLLLLDRANKMSSSNYQASWQSATSAAPPSVTIKQDTKGYRDNGEGERLKNVGGLLIPTLILWFICLVVSLTLGVLGRESWARSAMSNEGFQVMMGTALAFCITLSAIPVGIAARTAIKTAIAAEEPGLLDMARQYRKRFVRWCIISIIWGLITTCLSILFYFMPSMLSTE
jgi:hypothetical protein